MATRSVSAGPVDSDGSTPGRQDRLGLAASCAAASAGGRPSVREGASERHSRHSLVPSLNKEHHRNVSTPLGHHGTHGCSGAPSLAGEHLPQLSNVQPNQCSAALMSLDTEQHVGGRTPVAQCGGPDCSPQRGRRMDCGRCPLPSPFPAWPPWLHGSERCAQRGSPRSCSRMDEIKADCVRLCASRALNRIPHQMRMPSSSPRVPSSQHGASPAGQARDLGSWIPRAITIRHTDNVDSGRVLPLSGLRTG